LREPEVAPHFPGLGTGGAGGEEQRRPCPMCGEMILVSAVKCRFCGEIFDPALKRAEERQRRRSGPSDDDLTGGEILLAFPCNAIGAISGSSWWLREKPKVTKMFIPPLTTPLTGLALRSAPSGGRPCGGGVRGGSRAASRDRDPPNFYRSRP